MMKRVLQLALCACLILVFFAACEDPTEIGTELLNQSGDVNTTLVDSLTLEVTLERRAAFTLNREVSGFNPATQLLGRLEDPIFGNSIATGCMTFGYDENNLQFDSLPEIDSIAISIAYFAGPAITGDASIPQKFYVYEATSGTPVAGEESFSDQLFGMGELLGEGSVMLDANPDSTFTDVIVIELNSEFGTRLLDKIGDEDSIFVNSDNFQEYFNGIIVVPDSENTAIVNYSDGLSTSYLSLNVTGYNADTLRTTERKFGMGIITSSYEKEGAGSVVDQLIASEELLTDKVYMQGMGGAQLRVRIPHLLELKDQIVNYAEIELTREIDSTMLDTVFLDPVVVEMRLDPADYSNYLDYSNFDYRSYLTRSIERDSIENRSWIRYTLPVTFSLQRLLIENENRDLLIRVRENGVRYSNDASAAISPSARRGIYNGPAHPEEPMVLRLYYTENE